MTGEKVGKNSIKRKMISIIMMTSIISLLLPSLGYFLFDYTRLRKSEIDELTILSRIIAANISAPLTFDDVSRAQDVIDTLKGEPRIQQILILDQQGEIFLRYPDRTSSASLPHDSNTGETESDDEVFQLTLPILLENQAIGKLFIEANFHYKDRLIEFFAVVLLVTMGTLTLVYFLSHRLQTKIFSPLFHLTQIAQRVSDNKDYNLRATQVGDDELGQLIEQFNEMLNQIKNRDVALHQAQMELEQRVKERTSELEIANFRLQLGIKERKKVESIVKTQNQILEFTAKGRSLTESMNLLTTAVENQMNRIYCSIFVLDDSQKRLKPYWTPSLPHTLVKELDGLTVESEAASCGTAVLRKETVIVESIETSRFWRDYKHFALSAGMFSCWSQPFFDHKGNVLGTFAMYSDFVRKPTVEELRMLKSYANLIGIAVNRKRIEQGMQDYAMELARSNQDLEDFAAIASHDLQEPLRKVIAFGDRLQHGLKEHLVDKNKDYFDRMIKSTERMQEFLNDLLNYSRVNTKAEPFVTTNLESLIQEVLYDLELRIQNSEGEVKIGQLPFMDIDPRQMKQLFQNLIGNSLKFHREGVPPKINISATISGKNIEIRVRDNGIGFDEIYLDRVFKPFERLHGRDQFEGSGMGLAICRKIVHRHQGVLTAESKPGEGTTFIITLPQIQET